MSFFTSAIDTLQILVVALGAGLGAWGDVYKRQLAAFGKIRNMIGKRNRVCRLPGMSPGMFM